MPRIIKRPIAAKKVKKTKKVKRARRLTKKKQRSLARSAKRRGLSLWSREVRNHHECCVACGAVDHLNSHHILPKEYYHDLMFELNNGVALCPKHHKFGKYSAHKNPVWFTELLWNQLPDQYIWVIKRMGEESDV